MTKRTYLNVLLSSVLVIASMLIGATPQDDAELKVRMQDLAVERFPEASRRALWAFQLGKKCVPPALSRGEKINLTHPSGPFRVWFAVLVDTKGKVAECDVLMSEYPLLADSDIEAAFSKLRARVYSPATVDGTAVPFVLAGPVTFGSK
jgi:hypothetical protein